MEELFRLIEKKGEATDSEIFNGIYKEHLRLGLMPLNEVSIQLKKIILDLTRIKPGAIHDRLQFYILILIVILFPSGGNFLSFPFNLRNDQILFIYVTYSLRKEIKLPLEMISQIFYESVKKFSLQKPFYELKSIYFYQRVPELLKNIDYRDSREFIRVFLDFFESCQDLSNIDHSTIIFFNSMVQQCISYLIHDRNDIIVNQCNTLFTRIFSLHTVCPSVILLHFLHLWYIFFRFCTEKEIKISYEPQIHLISQLFKSISISQKHELYRFFHWNLVLTIRSKFPDAICEFNSLCLTLTFYKTIYHIESMRDMVIPSTEFLKEVLEQSKNKKRFSYCTILSFFNSCLKEFINSFSEFYLLVINPNSEETQQNKIKPIKISFSDQQKCSRNSDHSEFHFLDDHLYTIMNEKIIELSEFSLQFESLITRCELTKARIVTAGYFLFPCYKRALSNFEYLPYVIQITKTFLNVVIYINHAIFSIQYINVIPNKNLDLPLIINKIKDSFTEMPLRMAPYISITIAKLLFKKCKIFKITRLTVEFLCSLNDDILNLLMKDMIQIILTNKSMFFSKDFETTYWICRFTILTIRILSDRKHEELEKELIPVFQKSILRSILTNIKKISNQNIVFKTLNIFVKHFNLNYTCYPAKPTYLDEVMVYAKKDFLYSFLSLLPYNTDMQKAQFFNPVYEYALKYGDQESINIASQYCLKIFTINEKPKITNDLHYANLYQAWKNANLTKEDREKMITTIPYYSDYFISNRTHEIHDKLSYNEIYNCIFNSINSDPDSVILAFSVFQNAILNPELTLDEGKSLLNIFMRCLVYSFMRERIDKFIPIMLKYHIDLFLKEISNVFLLSLIEAPSVSVSYVASEMHDLAIKFVEIVTKENPDCPLILQTIDQVLLIIPKKERAYSILSLICILLRCCPKFVTVELIRSFIIASNDIFAFDVFFNRSISQLFEKYISVIDKETAQIFGESLFYLFSTTIINFRIPILQTLFKLNLNPPKLEFFKKSNFKCFELQKIMVSLLYESQINPFIIEQTKKCILEKNELVAAPERFSRRFSLIYSLVSNDHNFSYFADDQSFSNKLMTLLNNSMVSSYRELRKEAKTFFLTLLRLIEKETKETKFENPVELKLFEFFDNRLEKIIYVKRLLKIKPELFQPKLFLDFIASIGSYLTKSEEEQSNYLANLKIFFSFIGSKEINKYQGLGEFLSKNVNSYLTYFTHFIESYHKLLISNQFPYHTIIIKHTFNFLINFPEKTLKCMIDSAQSSQLYPSYLALIDFDDSTPFHNQFINLCKNKYDPFLYPLHYFEVIVKMTKIKSCVENYEFLDLIDFIFNQIVTRYDNITNNLYFMLFRMITALTNTFKFNEDINRFMLLLQSFDVPLTFNSISYRKIIKKCVKQTSQQFKLDLIKYFIRNPGIIRRAIFDKALQHLIKQTKQIPDELIDETWNFLIETKYISSMLRLLQHSVPSDEIISKICNIMRNTMMESDTELIIQTIKLMIQLGKLDKLPADIYWAYIKQSLYLFKFIDIPFSKYTLQMLKLMKDHFPNVPTDIGDGFSLFIHNKCNSIRETQRIIEILLCAPPLTQVNCFSPIIILSSFLNDRLQMINDLPQKASFDCILNIGIKYIALNEVPQNELEKYFDVTYRFLELMVIGMPYLTFLDKISSYLNDHDLPTPPESLFNAISNENNKFLLPSFVSLCIFMKKDPIKCLKCSSLIERALEFIEKSDNFINAITLQCFTELVCQDERYVELIYSIYKSLMEDISQKKEQKAFQIIFSMMKANVLNEHYEQMWDLLIEKEKKEAYTYLNAKEQIRYTKYMLSKSANHELFVIQSANVFLDSNLVSIEAKILLISNLANFVNYSNADLIFNCVEKIERLGISIKRNFTAEIADILIEAARCSTYLNKIKYIRKLGLLISEKITDKLDFVFNCLPVFLWRNETVIFVLSVFATDLKKWLSIFAFGNSFQHIISEFVVHFLRDHLKEETIKLFSDFFSKVLSTNDKTQFDGIINGLSYIFFSTDFPIHSKIFAKAEKVINHPEYLIDFMDNLSTFSDSEEYFLPHYMNDFIFGKFGYHLSVAERAVISLNLLSKFNTSDELYYQIRPDSNDSKKLYFLFHQINEDEKCFWSFISKKNFYFEIPVDEINKTSYNLELDHQVIESLLNQAHEKLAIEFQENMSFFKDELFASIETAIQIEKYLIQQKMQKKRPTDIPKVSMDLLLFKQSINPFLLSMLSNFKDELKSLLKIPPTHHPEIENSSESPPILSVPSFYVKNFKKISGITAHGLFAVSVEQIQNFLDTLRMSCPPNNKDLIKLSPILFEIYRISPCDDLFKAVYCSYSLLVHTNVNVPLYIRHQAGARILLLLQFACNKAHFDVIHYNSAVFERKNLDIWRHWLNQLVILSTKKEMENILLPLYIDMGYRALLYAKQMHLKDIEDYLTNLIPPSLIPLEKLGIALDIIFENKGLGDDYDHIISLINQSFPFSFPLYKKQITIYHLSGPIKYLSDQLVLLTLSTTINSYTPILIQRCAHPNSDKSSCITKTFLNSLYLMNLITYSSYTTRTKSISISSPFAYEIGNYYLLAIVNGESLYLKEIFDQITQKEKSTEATSLEEDGEDDASTSLLKLLNKKCTKYEFILNRNSLLRSLSAHSFIRHIFSIGYPHLEKMVLFINPGSWPLLTIDYERNILLDDLRESSIRYSPIFYRLFGCQTGIPVFQIGIAAVACAFVDNLESIRSYLEVLFYDKLLNINDEKNEIDDDKIFDYLITKRTEIEEKILNLTPPSGMAASVDDLVEWMSGMDSLIQKAMNESIQPASAFPWF